MFTYSLHREAIGYEPPTRSGFMVQGSGFRVQGSGFRVQASGCIAQAADFRLQGFRVRSCVQVIPAPPWCVVYCFGLRA